MMLRFFSHTAKYRNGVQYLIAIFALCWVMALASFMSGFGLNASDAANDTEAANSSRAFLRAYDVLMHPRCLNCHPKGDRPLQGDDSRPHSQNVQRGATGHGKYALKCSNCHQEANQPGEHMPPGTPNWHMPPADMPMVFEGRAPAVLCRQLLDPEQNGNMDLEDIITHVSDDDLVLWGWGPGDGRTLPSLNHAEFVKAITEWIEKGAACPD